MKDFKFLKRNTWYNPNQQVTYAVCGSTTNYISVINTTNVMGEVVNASVELRERIVVLEEEIRRLRNDLELAIS
jgi:hypothetical protein